MSRPRRVIAYDATVPEGDRALAVIPYPDAPLIGEGRGTYWVPVAAPGWPWLRRRRLRKIADGVAKGIAREYELRQGLCSR